MFRFCLAAISTAAVLALSANKCIAQPTVTYGPATHLLTDDGPISFGLIVSVDVVSWSSPTAQDLLVTACGFGTRLYPSTDLKTFGDPIQLCGSMGHTIPMTEAVDVDDDGQQEVIGTDRNGKLFCMKRTGHFPNLKLETLQDPLTCNKGVPFNIPFHNPAFQLSSQFGYISTEYFNYTYATSYPSAVRGSLIVGDWSGALWFMPCHGTSDGIPQYDGTPYTKSDGKTFVKPAFKLADRQGQTLHLGPASEAGKIYTGAAARPLMYQSPVSKTDDLLVLCGNVGNEFHYLHRGGTGEKGQPIFEDLGEITLLDMPSERYDAFCYHAAIATVGSGPWKDLLMSHGSDIAYFRNLKTDEIKPSFQFSHWLTGQDVPTRGYNYTGILTDAAGRRYLLENDNEWSFREILNQDGQIRLSSKRHDLLDQNGIFRVDGITDANHGTRWGFHRAALWDYDNSGKQHLIVGTDRGLLYLLREEQQIRTRGEFRFRSSGPLKDNKGNVIKIHNRVVAAPLDLNHDGRQDLVLAGASYQLGAEQDPNPGCGIYYALNLGVDSNGAPILSESRPLPITGHTYPSFTKRHAAMQSLDLLGNGQRVLCIGIQTDNNFRGHVYRPDSKRPGIVHTGITLPALAIEQHLLDLDNDGQWEFIRSGGESLQTNFSRVMITP